MGDYEIIQHFGHAARMNLEARQRIAELLLSDLHGAVPVATGLWLIALVVDGNWPSAWR